MSEGIGQSENHTKGSGRQFNQSSWMSHWMRTSVNPAAEAYNHRAPANEQLSQDDSLMSRLEISGSANKVAAIETIKFRILNENLRSSLKSLQNEGLHSSAFNHGQGADDSRELNHAFGQNLEFGNSLVCKSGIRLPSAIPAANRIFFGALGEGTSKNPLELMKIHSAAEDRSFGASKPLQESSSHVVPHRFEFENCRIDKGKAAISSLMNNPLPNSNLRMAEHEHWHNGSQPANFGYESKMDNHLQSDNSINACFREVNPPLLFEAPSMGHPHLPQFDQGWFRNMKKYSSVEFIPTMEKTKSKKSHQDRKFPTCVHDVETLRIFSQTTHSLLITKKTDVDVLKENNTFRSTRVVTEINGKASCDDLDGLSPFFGQSNQGVKLQLLSSSSDTEGKGNVSDVKASNVSVKNESSAETDTLDMDFLKENLHTGTDSTTSPKMEFTGLPDMNVELPASLAENICASSSRTQSLEMDMLLVHAEQPNTKVNLSLDNSAEADLSNRWVKRLKLSSSKYSATQISKSSNLDENLSHEKMSKYFSKILKNSINSSSGPRSKEDHDLSVVGPTKKDVELLLSHSWIQRWLSNESRIARSKSDSGVIVCEPRNSKLELEELEKKQFPSIGAMALMGKAMNGYHVSSRRGALSLSGTQRLSKYSNAPVSLSFV